MLDGTCAAGFKAASPVAAGTPNSQSGSALQGFVKEGDQGAPVMLGFSSV
jgi:hypothetical protein